MYKAAQSPEKRKLEIEEQNMGRSPSCAEVGLNRGAWTSQEDKTLIDYINLHGEGQWRNLPRKAGLKRCGKSCRLRWMNYLRPDIKRGNISPEEDDLIIRLHMLLGNRWSLIAGRLPGRTDNEIKNYWNTNLSKKIQEQQALPSGSSSSVVGKSKKSNNATNHYRRRRSLSHNIESPSTSSYNVVRPKAHKCAKVFFGVPQLPHNIEHKAGNEDIADRSPSALENSMSTPNYMADFELFMTNLLRSDFSSDDRLFWEETTMLPQQYRGNDPAVQNNAVLGFQTSLNSFPDDDHGDWLACLRG